MGLGAAWSLSLYCPNILLVSFLLRDRVVLRVHRSQSVM